MHEKTNTATLLQKGLRELSHHRPDRALETLRQAVEAIPPSCSDELSRALYWLSVALLRLDKKELAVKSLATAQKLRRRGHARRVYLRTVNEYGMPKQPTAELDDFYAFMNIQMAAYLLKKPRRKFDSFSEREAVLKLMFDSWKALRVSASVKDADCGEKLLVFRKFKISFPDFSVGGTAARVVRGSFQTSGNNMGAFAASGRCSCGSGLPYSQCCGRVRGVHEI